MEHTELLAPAGDARAFKAAIAAGASAIYFGLTRFSARTRATNITIEELSHLVPLAKAHGVKLYLTINTLLLESELDSAVHLAKSALDLGVDALIVQDVGLLSVLRTKLGIGCKSSSDVNSGSDGGDPKARYPNAELHASTQMTTHNGAQIEFLARFGVTQVNLSRELSIEAISRITTVCKKYAVKAEVFVHGAFCVSFSGQCYLSGALYGEQGNRGSCVQPCRRAYRSPYTQSLTANAKTRDYTGNAKTRGFDNTKNGGFVPPFHLKDNCAFPLVKELIDAGASSFKIEGRIKNAEYVYAVTRAWARQLKRAENGEPLLQTADELTGAINRGYTCDYLRGTVKSDMFSDGEKDVSLTEEGTVTRYHADGKTLFITRNNGNGARNIANTNKATIDDTDSLNANKTRAPKAADTANKARGNNAQTVNAADTIEPLKPGDIVHIKEKNGTFVCSAKIEAQKKVPPQSHTGAPRAQAHAQERIKAQSDSLKTYAFTATKTAHGARQSLDITTNTNTTANSTAEAYTITIQGKLNGKIMPGCRVFRSRSAVTTDEVENAINALTVKETPLRVRVHGVCGGRLIAVFCLSANGTTLFAQAESESILSVAKNGGLTADTLRSKLGRLGGTGFMLESFDATGCETGLFVPIGELNTMRRACVESLKTQIAQAEHGAHKTRQTATRENGNARTAKTEIAAAPQAALTAATDLNQNTERAATRAEKVAFTRDTSRTSLPECVTPTALDSLPSTQTATTTVAAEHTKFGTSKNTTDTQTAARANRPKAATQTAALNETVTSFWLAQAPKNAVPFTTPCTQNAPQAAAQTESAAQTKSTAQTEPAALSAPAQKEPKARLAFICAEPHTAQTLLQNGHTVLYELPLSFDSLAKETCARGAIPYFAPILFDSDLQNAESLLRYLRASPSFATQNRVWCANTGLALRAAAIGFTPILAMQLNITNSAAAAAYAQELNAAAFVPSCELSPRDAARLTVPRGVELWYPLYTHDELMQSRQCLVKNLSGCKSREVTRECIETCAKSVLCTGANGEKLRAVKRAGSYTALYNEHIVSAAPFVPILKSKVDVWTVDLRFLSTPADALALTQKAQAVLDANGNTEAFDAVSRRTFFIRESAAR